MLNKLWGFHPMQEAFYNALKDENPNVFPARVTFTSHEHYRVLLLGVHEERLAKLRGHFYHENRSLPVVGDWVAIELLAGDHEYLPIVQVLPQRSALKRADRQRGEQILMANVDCICLVTSFNQDLNLRRLERGLAMITESGANPLIVLNKSDLVSPQTVAATLCDLGERFRDVPIVACSAQTQEGLKELVAFFEEGHSVAFLGMSGVGKSTLVNALLSADRMKAKNIREDDSRGQHTTTHRELILTPQNFWLLDSPGIREFAVAGDEEALRQSFDDIAALMSNCRFGDCSHTSEPDCGVLTALISGELEHDRWENFLKMQREMIFHARKHDKAFMSEVKKGYAQRSRHLRRVLKQKGKK